MMLSATVPAESNEVKNSVKDISIALTSINQETVNAYDSKSSQINIPVKSFQNASATLNYQLQEKVKSAFVKK